MLRIYRGPDDDDNVGGLATCEAPPSPWWAGRERLTVGQFLSGVGAKGFHPGSEGQRLKSWARQTGRLGEMVRIPSTEYGSLNTWPVDLLLDYYDGATVGGVMIEGTAYRNLEPARIEPAA